MDSQLTTYRLANSDDYVAISTALLQLAKYAEAYDWAGRVDLNKAYRNVIDVVRCGKAYVVDGYLVLTDTLTPWYSNDSLLEEWLVLKLYTGGSVGSIPPAIEAIAKELGCIGVLSADSSPVNIVGKA